MTTPILHGVRCPACGAKVGEECWSRGAGTPAYLPHRERRLAARWAQARKAKP